MKFENAGTKILSILPDKEMAFTEIDGEIKPADTDDLDLTSRIIWIEDTNLKDPKYDINDHVWLFHLKSDSKHYAVLVDVGNGWFYWDGSIIAKDEVKVYMNT